MWNEPTDAELRALPRLYETENVPTKNKMILLHFFIGACDWYAAEYDPEERIFFGFAILNGDLQNAEWGYVAFDELREIQIGWVEIDRDLHWKPCRAEEVELIATACGWSTKTKRIA